MEELKNDFGFWTLPPDEQNTDFGQVAEALQP